MATASMTEKDMFLGRWQHEFETTVRVLQNYPEGKDDFRPAEKSRTARELAWNFVTEDMLIERLSSGRLEPGGQPPPAPALSVGEILRKYQDTHANAVDKVRAMPPETFEHTVQFPVGPKRMGDVRIADACWMMMMDCVHHRGQLSVYLRMLGAPVPSIVGPSADEPWR